jgi:ABC-2 type transport system permease protein
MKQKDFVRFLIGIVFIVCLNLLSGFYFFRIDLTEEQRYSISSATKKILQNLDDEVLIKVYLEGDDFPAAFKRLQKAVEETLDEFKVYAGKKIRYRFIDPSKVSSDKKEQNKFYQELFQKGIQPTNIHNRQGENRIEKLIFPGALMSYKEYEIPVMLFKTVNQKMQNAPSPEQILNQSVENIEYNLIAGIRKLTLNKRKKVALMDGHGELENVEIASAITRLQEYYDVGRIMLPLEPSIPDSIDAIIVAKPDSAFSDEDKYKLDQYIMRGGKAFFCIDVVGVYMDSVMRYKGSFTFPAEHNLTDLFFKYGVRLEPDLVKDLNASMIPIVVGNMGDKPNIKPIPWQYYPLINTFAKHPIVKNLGTIQTKFISSITEIKSPNVQKTPLLFTSKYTKTIPTPYQVLFEEERKKPDIESYNKPNRPVAYLLEGQFTSPFKATSFHNRKGYLAQSKPTKIIICSDGDILRNEVNRKTGEPLELGFDMIYQVTHSNLDFLENAMNYLIEEDGIISAKNKEITIRPLDRIKIDTERVYWQVLNMTVPVVLVIILGIVFFVVRKRSFS